MADKDHLILTAIGPDQVGLVEKISEFISRHGCNIEDSKMAVFCGEFAVIVLDQRRRRQSGQSRPRLSRNRNRNRLWRFRSRRRSCATPPGAFLPYKLTASCMDHPGIVYQISAVLSSSASTSNPWKPKPTPRRSAVRRFSNSKPRSPCRAHQHQPAARPLRRDSTGRKHRYRFSRG